MDHLERLLGCKIDAKHCIELLRDNGKHIILKYFPRCTGCDWRREDSEAEVEKMLARKVKKLEHAKLVVGIVFAAEKTANSVFVSITRKLNAIANRDSYLIPKMQDCIASSGTTDVLSTSDAKDRYCKLRTMRRILLNWCSAIIMDHKVSFVPYLDCAANQGLFNEP